MFKQSAGQSLDDRPCTQLPHDAKCLTLKPKRAAAPRRSSRTAVKCQAGGVFAHVILITDGSALRTDLLSEPDELNGEVSEQSRIPS